MNIRRIAIGGLLVATGWSVVLNVLLADGLLALYREFQTVRLNPAGSGAFRAEKIDDEPLVILFGDSRIAQWMPLPAVEGCRVVRRGVGGQTTAQALLRLDEDVLAARPRAVVVQVGINDLKTLGVLPDRREAIVESCLRNIETLVDRMAAQGIEVVVLPILPPGPVDLSRRLVWSEAIGDSVEQVNGLLLGWKKDHVTILECRSLLAPKGGIKPEYAGDTLHLTLAGYETLNRQLEPVLRQMTSE